MTLLEQLRAIVSAVPAGGSVTIPRDWLAAQIEAPAPPAATGNGAKPAGADRLLSAEEVAAQLGVSPRWVYDHQAELGGKRLSRRCLRFPEAGIQRHVERRR